MFKYIKKSYQVNLISSQFNVVIKLDFFERLLQIKLGRCIKKGRDLLVMMI